MSGRRAARILAGGLRQSASRQLPTTTSSARRTLLTARKVPSVWRGASASTAFRPAGIQARSMFIQTQDTPNPSALKFLPGQRVMPEDSPTPSLEILDDKTARHSPLAQSLFAISGVKSLFFGPDFISVNKFDDAAWPTMKPEIFSTMMEFFSSGQPILRGGSGGAEDLPVAEDTRILDTDSETVAMIKELLETRVRPTIQDDGGDLEFQGFDEETGTVKLMLKGSCRGCDSSTVTLKSGIERMLMHYIPEVKEVEQVISPEERVANDEFAKFEARLRSEGKSVSI